MGLLELASNNSFWRGVDYYEHGKVSDWKKVADNKFEARVSGSDKKHYDVLIDVDHPKRSTCNCPHAEGTRRVCKHKVALYLTLFPEELQRIMKEVEEWEAEEEVRLEEERESIKEYVYSLSKQELRDQLLWRILEENERRW